MQQEDGGQLTPAAMQIARFISRRRSAQNLFFSATSLIAFPMCFDFPKWLPF